MTSKAFTAPSLQNKKSLLLCILCLFWNLSLVQSTINSTLPSPPESSSSDSSSIVTLTKRYDNNNNNSNQSLSANLNLYPNHAGLIPFEEDCIAHVTHMIGDDGPRTQLMCTVDGIFYLLPTVSEEWIQEQTVLGELISDETVMILPGDAMLNPRTYEIFFNSEPPSLWNHEMEERERRRKLRRLAITGAKTVLVVRVQATDATTTSTAAQLGNFVFGDDGSTLNLKVQTAACSHNQVTINKATARTGSTTSIANGIVTIPVSIATSAGETTMINTITTNIKIEFGVSAVSDLADYAMYCFPPGTMATDAVAYAVLNGFLSFYNDEACTYPSAQIHEIGHNYNMGHSSDSAQEYGDKSGLMGFSYKYTDIPYMCFNAAKSWQLGWYTSKAVSITPSSSSATYSTPLAGVVDYSTTSNKVLIEIQQTSSTTFYYINYNRATGINVDTQEGADSVMLVSKDTSVESNVSMNLAILSSGQSHTLSDFNGVTGETLTITFTSLANNEANVDIVLSGFPVGPTTTPSVQPSITPSRTPSRAPSTLPSTIPSNSPSGSASAAPSRTPSRAPSTLPSLSPSLSFAPSLSRQPSQQPSSSAAPSLSAGPSVNPSRTPSTVPSAGPSLSNNPTSSNQGPSAQPSKLPSTAPSIAPSRMPVTPSPTGLISVQRIATIVVEIGIDGLNDLPKICTGLETFLKTNLQIAFNTNTQTSIICTRGQTRNRGRELFGNSFLDYEKPILVTVTTSFADFREAPRQFGFLGYLEDLIVSEKAQTELPNIIQQAMGSSVAGVHIRLVQVQNKPILIVAFGDQPPTPSPTTSPPGTGGTTQTSAAANSKAGYLLSSVLVSAVGGIFTLLL
eukprot:CAMPEP_0113624610 /NCGR_PEP_ID=MMETSP0017_2-20120614/12694_1 /TAXON_ID=2856 /ORGANISM="Cylindrotheca closterium" /LENGTH=850 /DNA_ID=CAMNT_0000534661 /DNA_START=60 /DNA_END=2612 /DNA_ORIENTATION=+ /assembly_acc=CAM_ASM_000147